MNRDYRFEVKPGGKLRSLACVVSNEPTIRCPAWLGHVHTRAQKLQFSSRPLKVAQKGLDMITRQPEPVSTPSSQPVFPVFARWPFRFADAGILLQALDIPRHV